MKRLAADLWPKIADNVLLTALCAALVVGGCQCEDGTDGLWDLDEPDGGQDALSADVIDVPSTPPPVACDGQLPERSRITPEEGDTDRARLVVDEQGCPHVAYFQEGDGYNVFDVKYARWDGEGWQSEVVATTSAMDWLVDLALDEQGQPTLVYADDDRHSLWFARRDDQGVWQSEHIASLPWMGHLRYVRDPSGQPAVLVTHDSPGALSYLERRGEEWTRQEILRTQNPRDLRSPPVFDAAGQPHVVLAVSGGDNAAYYAYRQQSAEGAEAEWVVERVAEAPSTLSAGLTLDRDDQPHVVACHLRSSPSVTHHWRTSSGWQQETIESEQMQVYGCGATAFDGRGRLHVLYGVEDDSNVMQLRHATRTSDGWTAETFDGFVRIDIELVIDKVHRRAHMLAMEPLAEESPDMHERGATYLHSRVD